MKIYKAFPNYPEIHRHYKSYDELAEVINRSKSYINNCLNGRRDFTDREKKMIAADMKADISEIFPEVA